MFGKLINDIIIYAPERVLKYVDKGKYKIVLNPNKKHYLKAGYKEIEFSRNTVEGEYDFLYTEGDDYIHIDYIVKE